jgi:CheY-like chemotaxis protein
MAKRALIIEDNPDIQYILKMRLELVGYTTYVAEDGFEALKVLESAQPNILLLDLGLPRMNGYTFLDELERRRLAAPPVIIVLTADQEAMAKLAHRPLTVLLKPYPLDLLLAKIQQFD